MGPNAAAIETLVKEGAKLIVTVDCGTTSYEPLAHGAPARCRCRRHRPPPGRRAASRGRSRRQSEPPGRHFGAGHALRGRRRVPRPRRDDARAAAAGLLWRCARARSAWRFSTSWRSRPLPTSCRSIGLNRAYVKKGLAVMRAPGERRPYGARRRRRANGAADALSSGLHSRARASMLAAASAMPRSAQRFFRRPTRSKRSASPSCSIA